MPGPSRSSFRSQYSVLDADTPRIRGVPRIRVSVCGDVACLICIFPEHMGAIIVGGGPAPFEACRVHGSGCARYPCVPPRAHRASPLSNVSCLFVHTRPPKCAFFRFWLLPRPFIRHNGGCGASTGARVDRRDAARIATSSAPQRHRGSGTSPEGAQKASDGRKPDSRRPTASHNGCDGLLIGTSRRGMQPAARMAAHAREKKRRAP